jgi:hypothetical protein
MGYESFSDNSEEFAAEFGCEIDQFSPVIRGATITAEP